MIVSFIHQVNHRRISPWEAVRDGVRGWIKYKRF